MTTLVDMLRDVEQSTLKEYMAIAKKAVDYLPTVLGGRSPTGGTTTGFGGEATSSCAWDRGDRSSRAHRVLYAAHVAASPC